MQHNDEPPEAAAAVEEAIDEEGPDPLPSAEALRNLDVEAAIGALLGYVPRIGSGYRQSGFEADFMIGTQDFRVTAGTEEMVLWGILAEVSVFAQGHAKDFADLDAFEHAMSKD